MTLPLGLRIADAREKRKMLAQDLAKLVNLTPSAISLIESGQRQVKAHELAQIAEALGVSPLALLDPNSFAARLPVAARTSEAGLGDGLVMAHIRWLADVQEVVARYTPRPSMPIRPRRMDFVNGWITSSGDLADRANALLGAWSEGNDKFASLKTAIEENLAIDVLVIAGGPHDLLGAAIPDEGLPLIVINSDQPRPRALFTLAHELGHVLSCGGQTLISDADLSARGNPSERFANAFAAELLLPRDVVLHELQANDDFLDFLASLLHRSGASWQTLVYRLHNLSVINAAGRDELLAEGSHQVKLHAASRGLEPSSLDSSAAAEPSAARWLSTAALLAAVSGELGTGPVSQLMNITEDEVGQIVAVIGELRQDLPNREKAGTPDPMAFEEVPA